MQQQNPQRWNGLRLFEQHRESMCPVWMKEECTVALQQEQLMHKREEPWSKKTQSEPRETQRRTAAVTRAAAAKFALAYREKNFSMLKVCRSLLLCNPTHTHTQAWWTKWIGPVEYTYIQIHIQFIYSLHVLLWNSCLGKTWAGRGSRSKRATCTAGTYGNMDAWNMIITWRLLHWLN